MIRPVRPLKNPVAIIAARFCVPAVAGIQMLLANHAAIVAGVRKRAGEHSVGFGARAPRWRAARGWPHTFPVNSDALDGLQTGFWT